MDYRSSASITLTLIFTLLLLTAALSETLTMKQEIYRNPIIPGDWSDPALIRVGEDYYSLRSTFGWQPGMFIAHSKDLLHWEYIGYVYTDHPKITAGDTYGGCWGAEMGYNPNNDTFVAYAPIGGTIYAFASKRPEGPYSAPVDLGISAIDPGFFADDDSRLYLTHSEGEIVELTPDGLAVKRKVCDVRAGRGIDFEGPDIFKRGDYYYCLYSTGGTRPHQKSTISTVRARKIEGPWEADPENPTMIANDDTGARFQGPAHGTLVETQNGEWFVTYHAFELTHYSLGRQMCMEPVEWTKDGWWRPVGGKVPSVQSKRPDLPQVNLVMADSDEFDVPKLGLQWFFHTKPDFTGSSWTLTERPGFLRIKTRGGDISSEDSLVNVFLQRVTSKSFEISAKLEFNPKSGKEAAGIHLYHDPKMNLWLSSTIRYGSRIFEAGKYDDGKRIILHTLANRIGNIVYLKIKVDDSERASFYCSGNGEGWTRIGKDVYFGDSWQDLRDGLAGSPDLGWVGFRKRNCWTATAMGIFAVRDGARESNIADFDWFRVKK